MRIYQLLLIAAPRFWAMVLLYVGPDQILPLLSVLASIIGVLLIWWRRLVGFVRGTWRSLTRRPQTVTTEPPAKLSAAATAEPSAEE